MSSILFSRGVNTQAGNPVRNEMRKLENRIEVLEKKITALITVGGTTAAEAVAIAIAPPATPTPSGPALSRPAPGTGTGAVLRGR